MVPAKYFGPQEEIVMPDEEEYIAVVTRRYKKIYRSHLLHFMAHEFFGALDKAKEMSTTADVINLVGPAELMNQAKFILTSTRQGRGKDELCGWSKKGGWMLQDDPRVTEFMLSDIKECFLPPVASRMTPPEWAFSLNFCAEFCHHFVVN